MQTILVVDDTKSNIDILVELLSEYDIVTSLNGKDAIQSVKDEDIDLILLDIMMPQMDGFEVCNILKSDESSKNIPIIFLTAKTEKEDMEKGFTLGAVDYLTKPFYSAELKARVKTHLELRSYQKDLEKKVEVESRKNRLKDQMLFQKIKEAEIGELLMQISHQWKQPLMEIGSINMHNTALIKLGEKIEKNELLESFDKVSNILKFMSNTMESFQNFYKPDYKTEYFNVSEAINNALTIIGVALQIKKISVTIEQKNSVQVYGNFNEYSNVILTILNNVKDIVKLRELDGAKVVVSINSTNNGKSKVSISDDCGGIDYDDVSKIFLPFVTQKNSAGIGLYMAKNICKKYDGDIEVKNKDKGACFTIIL